MATTQYADFAQQLAATQAAAKALMADIRAAASYLTKKRGYSLTVIASKTGLHKNSVMRLSDRSWFPKPDTLAKLTTLIAEAEGIRSGEIAPHPGIKRGRPKGSANGKAPPPSAPAKRSPATPRTVAPRTVAPRAVRRRK